MAVLVALGLHNRDLAVFVHRQKVVATRCRLDGVCRDLDVAVRAVFKPNRCRQARGQLAVDLAFGGACANRAPADQVADVLG